MSMPGFRRPTVTIERMALTDNDIKIIAEAVVDRMLNAPSGDPVTIRHPKGTFSTLLGGVPRPGDILWLPLRRNSKPKRWRVTEVEWFVEWPFRNVEVHVREEPLEGAAVPHK